MNNQPNDLCRCTPLILTINGSLLSTEFALLEAGDSPRRAPKGEFL